MDKQKQIEEMAKVIEEAMAKARRTLGGHNNIAMFYATMLSNAGYRKIPENAVVMTREEYDGKSIIVEMSGGHKLKLSVGKFGEMSKILEEHTRKETAEKFAERLKEQTVDEYDSKGVNHPYVIADYEELDEICKEITDKVVQNGN